jgi:hypothetical protein
MQFRRIAIATVIAAAMTPGAALAASKVTVGGGHGTGVTSTLHVPPPVVSYVESYSSGEPGSASDQTCDQLAGAVNNDYDTALNLLQGGDNASTWALLKTVNALQDYAGSIGCVVINAYDV